MNLVFEGLGMHSGKPCRVEVELLSKHQGRHIQINGCRKALDPRNLRCDRRCSEILGVGPLEHLAASLLVSGWSDWCLIVEGDGIPLLDGSAGCFQFPTSVEGVPSLHVHDFDFQICTPWGGYLQATAEEYFHVQSRIRNESWGGGVAELPGCLMARTFIDIDSLARALESGWLLGCGLGQGRIIGPALSESGRLLAIELGLDPHSSVLWGQSRIEAELAAHKVLDLVGDLSLLVGAVPTLDIKFEHVGHEQFHELGRALIQFVEASSKS